MSPVPAGASRQRDHEPVVATPLDLDDAVRRYEAGESARKIAMSLGVGRGVVERRLREAGVRIVPRGAGLKRAAGSPEQAAALYLDGGTVLSIAHELGCSTGTVCNWLREKGVETRSGMDRVAAAHAAVRGSHWSDEVLVRHAQARHGTLTHASPDEIALGRRLRRLGLPVVNQHAIGPYSADLGAHPVAVEVLGGNWHQGRERHRKRSRRIADEGWALVFVWVGSKPSFPIGAACAQQIVAIAEQARGLPSPAGQYWMVRGDGELYASGDVYDDDFAIVSPGRARR